jgi:glycosyltransferase involved in cell wall biosynthesis
MGTIVSVIIPTYNEEEDIEQCINSLQEQSYTQKEIIIVDDGSTDRTLDMVKRYPGIKILKQQHCGPGAARNLGANKAEGKILIFIDADMTFDKKYIENLIKPILKNKSVIGTTHDYEVVNNVDNIWSRCWGRIRVSKERAKDVKIFRAIRKSKFLEMGGFDRRYGYADDQTFWFKYKVRPIVAPDTTCYHKNPKTLKQVYKQSRWIGASLDFKLAKGFLKYFVPLIMILLFPIAIIPATFRKLWKQHETISLFPAMFIFLIVRYFGTVEGIFRNIYLDKNYR